MLDLLAEYEAQRDSLDAKKSALLAENKVPAEIQAIVADGTRRMNDASAIDDTFENALNAELSALVIPEEIREKLFEIDAARTEIEQRRATRRAELQSEQQKRRAEIQNEINAATAEVYAKVASKKAEIEAEFSESLDAVNQNIEFLKKKIKDGTIAAGETKKGKFWQSVFVKGRTTWITDRIDDVYFSANAILKLLDRIALNEEGASILDARKELSDAIGVLEKARKVGAPSTMLKRI